MWYIRIKEEMSLNSPLTNKVGVFVMSCDKTTDIAQHFILGLKKYWRHRNLPIYFGTNRVTSHLDTTDFIPVGAESGGWKKETLAHIDEIKQLNPELTHLIILLDDFILFEDVDEKALGKIISRALSENIYYLRLKRVEEGFFLSSLNALRPKGSIFRIRNKHPYYAALQIALWNIEYLKSCIACSKDIWEFEHPASFHKPHYSVKDTLFKYRHIVEKGEWEIYSESFCKKYIGYFEPGMRKTWQRRGLNKLKFTLKKPIFFIFGYSIMRLRKAISYGRPC